MKNKEVKIVLIIICSFVIFSCKKEDKEINNFITTIKAKQITNNLKPLKIDENWQLLKFKDGDKLYCPVKWKNIENQYSANLEINPQLHFILDISHPIETGENILDKEIKESLKNINIKDNAIVKFHFNNSNVILYHFQILEKKSNGYMEASNIVLSDSMVYTFTILSKANFSEKYIDTLSIISNTYKKAGNKRLVPILNGYSSIDIINK